jgi:hypothetical protein
MPRTVFPPTPSSSSDITGKDGTNQLASMQMSFELPPPAISPNEASRAFSTTSAASAAQAAYPVQASESVKSRRRPSTTQIATNEAFALPPPPTRSRKIIQMKPRPQEESNEASSSSKVAGKGVVAPSAGAASANSKKKQPSATSAAGRKIARKTAHSLIERRRRSKMNEEFAVLKGMIPACTGEMHKLAILQVSFECFRNPRRVEEGDIYIHIYKLTSCALFIIGFN